MGCDHSVRLSGLCAICGVRVKQNENLYATLHNNDQLMVTKASLSCAPALILDLDNTIVQTVLGIRRGTFHFQMDGTEYSVFVRPGLKSFLDLMNRYYEMHVYTMGTREYVSNILRMIDPDGTYFGGRVITRDENNNRSTKELHRLSIATENVIVVDDRADVWNYIDNLVLIRPFMAYAQIDAKYGRFGANLPERRDRELRKLSKYLVRVHKRSNSDRSIASILKDDRKRIFKGLSFYFGVDDPFSHVIKFCGGKMVSESPVKLSISGCFVLNRKKIWYVMRDSWVAECVFKRKRIPRKGYIVSKEMIAEDDLRNSEEMDYLEETFFR